MEATGLEINEFLRVLFDELENNPKMKQWEYVQLMIAQTTLHSLVVKYMTLDQSVGENNAKSHSESG